MIKVFFSFLKRHFSSIIYLGSALLILLCAYLAALLPNLKFDSDFEHFFPKNDSSASFYFEHRDKFGSDNDFIILGLEFEESALSYENLKFIASLTESFDGVEKVKKAMSISNLTYPIIESFGIINVPFINLENEESAIKSISLLKKRKDVSAGFISTDSLKAAIFITHQKIDNKQDADRLLELLVSKIESKQPHNYHLAGKLVAEKSYIEETIKELSFFVAISILLVIIYLWFTYRSWVGVLVPLILVLLTIVSTVGTMVFMGKQLDIMTVLMPCILFVVSMSDVIHIITEYEFFTSKNFAPQEAVIKTLKKVGLATFLTTLTTAFAFVTLKLSIIKPIGDFGFYSAIGVCFAYVLTIFLLPLIFIVFNVKKITKKKQKKDRLNLFLNSVNYVVNFKSKAVLIVSLIFAVFSLIGWSQLSINDTMLNDLSEKHPTKKDLNFFNNHFGGLRIFDIQFQVPKNSSVLSFESIQAISKIEEKLKDSRHFTSIISPVTLMKTFNQAFHSGEFEYFKIPSQKQEYQDLYKKSKPFLKGKLVSQIIDKHEIFGRLTARQPDAGSKLSLIQKAALEKEIKTLVAGTDLNYRITGSSDLIDQNNLSLSKNLFQSLGLNILLLVILVSMLFSSFKLGLIALICNILPILFIAGVMGFVGIDLSVSISIIFTIAFGIAVDDTIHFLSRYKLESMSNQSVDENIRSTLYNTGKAMIKTTFVIAAGFAVLMFSEFKSTALVGFMVTLTLLIAVLCDLILLPVLLKYTFKTTENQKTKMVL